MAEVAIGALQWQRAAINSPDLIAAYICDFTAASSFRFSPKGVLAATPATTTGAEGIIVDNMMNGAAVQMQVGPIIEVCPAFQKTYVRLDPLSAPDVVLAGSSGTTRVYFFTGAFHGNTQNINTYAAYKAGVVSTNTDGTQDVYFNSLRWKINTLLANNFNLDSLTDSGFFDVLNPTSPASGNLAAGTWSIESHVYSSSNVYLYQKARNILAPDTEVFERRSLGGNGWTPWRDVGVTVTGQCQFQNVNTTVCRLVPMGGGLVLINGNIEQVPFNQGNGVQFVNTLTNVAGGVAMAASTLYFAYVYMSAGVMVGEWDTKPFVLDARGNPIKSGDATRTCIGMVYTDPNAKFIDTPYNRQVASFFNRTWRAISGANKNFGTSATTPTAQETLTCLSWGTDAILFGVNGLTYANTAGVTDQTALACNGATVSNTQNAQQANPPIASPLCLATETLQPIGLAVMQTLCNVTSQAGSWNFTQHGMSFQ